MTRFACIGLDHGHIYGLASSLVAAGGEMAAFCTDDDDQAQVFGSAHSETPRLTEEQILSDDTIGLIVSAAIPSERAALAVRAMEAGMDVLLDKPAVVRREDLELIRASAASTGRRVRAAYSELEDCASVQTALALVRDGAIGRLVHYSGAGPHQMSAASRPDWFFDPSRNGGILADIASHQIAKFVAFCDSQASVTFARIARSSDTLGFQNLGEVLLDANGVHGYARVDWHTPDGLPTWGDGRIVLTGTEGVIEIRKYVDVGRVDGTSPLGEVLIITNDQAPRRVPCNVTSPFYGRILRDAEHGSETAMPQDMAFHIMDLAIAAQEMAEEIF